MREAGIARTGHTRLPTAAQGAQLPAFEGSLVCVNHSTVLTKRLQSFGAPASSAVAARIQMTPRGLRDRARKRGISSARLGTNCLINREPRGSASRSKTPLAVLGRWRPEAYDNSRWM